MRFARWVRFRFLRATGRIPWWWESDRRLTPSWDAASSEALRQAKLDGLF